LPFATATSICRSRFTTCSGWYFLPRPICSPCPVVSHPLVHFKPGRPAGPEPMQQSKQEGRSNLREA
jgi:hypothetical protein